MRRAFEPDVGGVCCWVEVVPTDRGFCVGRNYVGRGVSIVAVGGGVLQICRLPLQAVYVDLVGSTFFVLRGVDRDWRRWRGWCCGNVDVGRG